MTTVLPVGSHHPGSTSKQTNTLSPCHYSDNSWKQITNSHPSRKLFTCSKIHHLLKTTFTIWYAHAVLMSALGHKNSFTWCWCYFQNASLPWMLINFQVISQRNGCENLLKPNDATKPCSPTPRPTVRSMTEPFVWIHAYCEFFSRFQTL